VCGEADNGWSGVKKFNELKPDLVLLGLAMPDMDGIEAARLMSGSDPTVPIILFTVLDLEGLEPAPIRRASVRSFPMRRVGIS